MTEFFLLTMVNITLTYKFLVQHLKIIKKYKNSANKMNFVHPKSLICTLNISFSTTQYPLSILYLPTQIQMNTVYQKTGFKCKFSSFLMNININNHLYCFKKKTITIYLKAKNCTLKTNFCTYK